MSDAIWLKILKLWKMGKTQNHRFLISMGKPSLVIIMPVAEAKALSMVAFQLHLLGPQIYFRQNFLLWLFQITFNSKNIKSQHFFILNG